MPEHDVIVIGAGPAGEVCSGKLAAEGLDVCLVERELVGGECAYWACMPSKALLRPGQLLKEVTGCPAPGRGSPASWIPRRCSAVATRTNRQGTTTEQIPGSLIVLGGGAVGCELAQAWATLGAEVTLVEAVAAAARRGAVRLRTA